MSPLALALLLAATKEIAPGVDLEVEVNLLGPGDELVLRGGTYMLPAARFSIDDAVGTAAMPITVRGKPGERAVITRPDANQNLIDIVRADWLVFRDLVFQGGSAGLRFQDAKHVTIEGCEVFGTDDVAIRANDTGVFYDGFHIARNHI